MTEHEAAPLLSPDHGQPGDLLAAMREFLDDYRCEQRAFHRLFNTVLVVGLATEVVVLILVATMR